MPEARYFLAHTRQTPDAAIDGWTAALTQALVQPDWVTKVVPGRDDFEQRAAGLGGWKRWCYDVPCGCQYDGTPFFHGIVVPMFDVNEALGKATAQIVEGFIQQGKHAFAWSPTTNTFVKILGVTVLPGDNWKNWATLQLDASTEKEATGHRKNVAKSMADEMFEQDINRQFDEEIEEPWEEWEVNGGGA